MTYLKEQFLDVDRINKLSFEEYMDAMSDLTPEQVKEYLSKLHIKESNKPMQAVKVDYNRDDVRSGVDASELIQNLRKRLNK